jgi:Cu2+-exporting ATPase
LIDDRGCPTGLDIARPLTNAADPKIFVRQAKDGDFSLELLVKGAKCAGCLSKIENGLLALDGIKGARLNLSTGRLTTKWQSANFDPQKIVQTIVDLGYGAIPFQSQIGNSPVDKEAQDLLLALTVAGVAMMFVMMFSQPIWMAAIYGEMGEGTRTLFHWLSAIVALPAGIYAGMPFFSSAYRALRKGHTNMDVPISLALILTAALSVYSTSNHGEHAFFDAIVMLEFFLLIGRYLDHRLRQRSRVAAQELLALQAVSAQKVMPNGETTSVAVNDITTNDLILILPGDRIPVDGIIETGTSQADFSMINGETAPVMIGEGQKLLAGVLNLSGVITIRAIAKSDDSFLAEIARLVEAGEQSKSLYVRLADKAARAYVPIVHSAALLTFLGWLMVGGGFEKAIWNACAVLIITCPCALGLAVPAVQVVASGRLFKAGILLKTGDALERLATVNHVVFDKTGVLTTGQPKWINRDEISEEIINSAVVLARASRHPLARSIARAVGPGPASTSANELPGYGIESIVDGVLVRMGRAEWVGATQSTNNESELWFKSGSDPAVRFTFEDSLRPDAVATISAIRSMGIGVEVLSGDKLEVVQKSAHEAQISDFRGGQTPLDKAARLDELSKSGFKVLMVGDGLNDAPALARAFVSMAPGAAADASQSAADLVFQGEKLDAVREAIAVGRLSKQRVLENFWFSALYNLLTVPLAVFGLVTPPIAAIAMSSSSIVVSLNALRLHKVR